MRAAASTSPMTTALVPVEPTIRTPEVSRTEKAAPSKLGTVVTFMRRGACSNTLMTVLDRAHGHPMDTEERASDPLAGGMMMGHQCGMVWGSTLAAGAEAHRRLGPGPEAEAAALEAAARVVSSFRSCHGHVNCVEITEADPRDAWQTIWTFFFKAEMVRCFSRAARYAAVAHAQIDEALDDATGAGCSCRGGNCAARLARKLGASDLHVTMAAGLAGGIGLSGGGCGALGAAIWLMGIAARDAEVPGKTVQRRIEALKEAFLEATDYELECAAIVGRRFESAEDHAGHVAAGGCEALIDELVQAVGDLGGRASPARG